MPCVGISRTGDRFSEYEGGNSQGENRKDQETISISTLLRKSLTERLSKVNGETLLYSNGSSVSTSTIQVPSTTTNYRSLHEEVIRKQNCVTQGGKNGTGLVGAVSGSEQRTVHTVHCPTDSNPIRCFQVRLGSSVPRETIWGPWSQEERREPINLLELKTAQMAVMTFAERLKPESIHLQMDDHTALAYIRKMQDKVNQNMNQVGQELWELLIGNGITIIVEYLPGKLNPLPDKESREKDSSKWKLNPKIFQKMFNKRSCLEIDLFDSSPRVLLLEKRPIESGNTCIATELEESKCTYISLLFPSGSSSGKSLLLIAPAWQLQAWYPCLL